MGLLTKIKRAAAAEPVVTSEAWKLVGESVQGEVVTAAVTHEGGLPPAGRPAVEETRRLLEAAAESITQAAAYRRWQQQRQQLQEEQAAVERLRDGAAAALEQAKEQLFRGEDPSEAEARFEEADRQARRHENRASALLGMVAESRAEALREQKQALQATRDRIVSEAEAEYQEKAAALARLVGPKLMELLALRSKLILLDQNPSRLRVEGRQDVAKELNRLPGDSEPEKQAERKPASDPDAGLGVQTGGLPVGQAEVRGTRRQEKPQAPFDPVTVGGRVL